MQELDPRDPRDPACCDCDCAREPGQHRCCVAWSPCSTSHPSDVIGAARCRCAATFCTSLALPPALQGWRFHIDLGGAGSLAASNSTSFLQTLLNFVGGCCSCPPPGAPGSAARATCCRAPASSAVPPVTAPDTPRLASAAAESGGELLGPGELAHCQVVVLRHKQQPQYEQAQAYPDAKVVNADWLMLAAKTQRVPPIEPVSPARAATRARRCSAPLPSPPLPLAGHASAPSCTHTPPC
jgi:hypothetical protein